MADQVFTSEQGFVKISDEVFETIAALQTIETKGISHMGSTISDQLINLIGRKSANEGVKVQRNEDNSLVVDVYIIVVYGYRVPDVALRLQERIKSAIEAYTQTHVTAVNVFVQGIVFDTVQEPQVTVTEDDQ